MAAGAGQGQEDGGSKRWVADSMAAAWAGWGQDNGGEGLAGAGSCQRQEDDRGSAG